MEVGGGHDVLALLDFLGAILVTFAAPCLKFLALFWRELLRQVTRQAGGVSIQRTDEGIPALPTAVVNPAQLDGLVAPNTAVLVPVGFDVEPHA
ncbi:hypothetical protein XAP7430_320048 [Xanthomonas phaseoli pv. phaseoli]|uniref:Uncharacterized protein n=1 Tax=Xanthomonas campestris pv. phaseoli TaxID=317013 RepID=A0AB38DZ35_XANCH|nr:hypothetical protein XAP7430_320048 [Xanthomonas phaseoli pv. phaseoli]